MRRATVSLSVAATLLTLGLAVPAASAQPGTIAPVRQEPVEIEATIDHDAGIDGDVLGDRAWLSPTALTQPAGSLTFTYYQVPAPVSIVSATLGVTDQLHLTALTGALWDEDDGDETPVLLGAKYQVIDAGTFRGALQGAVTYVDDERIGTIGFAGSVCFDEQCTSLVSGYVGHAFDADDTDDSLLIVNASVIARLTTHLKWVMEVDSFSILNEDDVGVVGFYGVRFTSGRWAGDLGFAQPLGEGSEGAGFGLPMLSFSHRIQ